MFVFIVMVIGVLGVVGWLAWRDPDRVRRVAAELQDRIRQAHGNARDSGRALTPRVVSDRVLHTVVRGAKEMVDGTRLAKTDVHVYVSEEFADDLGREGLVMMSEQTQALIDRELHKRGWPSTGPTRVLVHRRATLDVNECIVELASGLCTELIDPLDTDERTQGSNEARRARAPQPGLDLGEGQVHALPTFGSVSYGRDPKCTIVDKTDPKVSRRHFTLSVGSGAILLTDTSSNGTWVDGKLVDGSVQLRPGSVITLAGPDRHPIMLRADIHDQATT